MANETAEQSARKALQCLYIATESEVADDVNRRVMAWVEELKLAHQSSEAVLSMAVARLGGLVEGRPTHRINFLQRIDELRRIEKESRHAPR